MNKFLEEAQGVIFDVDGLMIDSEPLWDRAREVFAEKYHKTIPSGLHDRCRGMGMKEVIAIYQKDLGIQGTVDDLVQEFRNTFYELALKNRELQLMTNADTLIRELFNKGKKLAIATGGHRKEKMIQILQSFDLDKYFSVIVSSDQVKHGKPAPDIFIFTAKEMNLDKYDCVILEDAVNGIQAAKNADMKVIGVQKEAGIAEKLRREKADQVVSSIKDLL